MEVGSDTDPVSRRGSFAVVSHGWKVPGAVAECHSLSWGRRNHHGAWVSVYTLPWPPALVDEGSLERADPVGCGRTLRCLGGARKCSVAKDA